MTARLYGGAPVTTAERLRAMIAAADLDMADLIARTGPKVTDGHSDGRRVRYVRAETRRETLAAILSMLESAS